MKGSYLNMKETQTFVVFLRGINVGGHHKVPMADLRSELESLGFQNVVTLLNTGNIIFDSDETDMDDLQIKMAAHLEQAFGFPIPTLIKTAQSINALIEMRPFEDITVTKQIRLYLSFLWREAQTDMIFPWSSEDRSYQIIGIQDKTIISVLDLSVTGTPKGMESLEKRFGKDMTTRNWNTILKIGAKLAAR